MRLGRTQHGEADAAKRRLLHDQLLRPLVEQRVRLTLLSARFERTGRNALIRMLSARMKQDPRYAPVLQTLVRLKPD